MQISSIQANTTNHTANSNHSQRKAGFSGIERLAKYPDKVDSFIESVFVKGENGKTVEKTVHPVIEKFSALMKGGKAKVQEFFIMLTGPEAQKYWEFKRAKNTHPVQAVLKAANQDHLLLAEQNHLPVA